MQFGRLGKLAPAVDPRVPHLFDRVALLQPKPAVDWTKAVSAFPMMGNDVAGDCTCAAAYHQAQIWTGNSQGSTWQPEDKLALDLYSTLGGYPKVDAGLRVIDLLRYWAAKGIQTDKGQEIIAFARLNPQNLNELRCSIEWFGGVYIGVALPLVAQSQAVWDVSASAAPALTKPNSWGGHAICLPAYDQDGFTAVTWGRLMGATNAFMQTYCDEAYALISRDWLDAKGISPPGLDWAALQADMASLKD
jgi:hypothetical protein